MMFDVVIVGAGPAGLNAALVLGRAQRRVLVADTGEPRNAPVRAMGIHVLVAQPLRRLPTERSCRFAWSRAGVAESIGFTTFRPSEAPGRALQVAYRRANPGEVAPIPDDFWTVADPTTATGLRLDLPVALRGDVREVIDLYRIQRIAHPGWISRFGNWALADNVRLGPWMHVGHTIRHLGIVHHGQTVSARSRVAAEYEHKGHRFSELDVVASADGVTIATIRHVAIYRPRQVMEL